MELLATDEELWKGVGKHKYITRGRNMRSEELNTAAIEAKTNTARMWDIKAHYMPLIEGLAKYNNNEAHFIDNCYRKVEYTVRSFDIEKGSFDGRAKTYIYQSVRYYCSERGRKCKVLQLVGEELDAIDRMDLVV